MSEDELVGYLNEHVRYEFLMLQYTREQLEKTLSDNDWNAMFAAFNVSARNLYDFLSNNSTRNEMQVLDYNEYRNTERRYSNPDITGTLQKLNAQCLHLGKQRFKEYDKKVNFEKGLEVFNWAAASMRDFLNTFEDDFRKKILVEVPDPKTHIVLNVPPVKLSRTSSSPTEVTFKVSGPIK